MVELYDFNREMCVSNKTTQKVKNTSFCPQLLFYFPCLFVKLVTTLQAVLQTHTCNTYSVVVTPLTDITGITGSSENTVRHKLLLSPEFVLVFIQGCDCHLAHFSELYTLCRCCGSILSLVQIIFSFVLGYGNV